MPKIYTTVSTLVFAMISISDAHKRASTPREGPYPIEEDYEKFKSND